MRPIPAGPKITLQWRAGQLPGQTVVNHVVGGVLVVASMEGRTIARPNCGIRCPTPVAPCSFNGGPDNCPAKPQGLVGKDRAWPIASMEGRTIARPNRRRARLRPAGARASMEGRTIARPNRSEAGEGSALCAQLQWRAGQLPGQTRYHFSASASLRPSLQWRAGQLPGQTGTAASASSQARWLQWRAGQLPGQTPNRRSGQASRASASMEGRTIARPNLCRQGNMQRPAPGFNGGPDNCPAKLGGVLAYVLREVGLQWRAGQLPGQTTLFPASP